MFSVLYVLIVFLTKVTRVHATVIINGASHRDEKIFSSIITLLFCRLVYTKKKQQKKIEKEKEKRGNWSTLFRKL